MSGFSFPPPPPPPPKISSANGPPAPALRGGHDRGRGRRRGLFQQPDFTQRGGRGHGGQSHHYQDRRQPHQHETPNVAPPFGTTGSTNGLSPPPRTAVGHKRKLDALRGPPQWKPENKPAPATAPSIPTFGAPLLPSKPQATKNQIPEKGSSNPKQKSLNRSLGLTPGTGDPQYSSSDNEDDERHVDEEAMYAELGDKLTFEHNGMVMSLSSQADVVAWKKERQRNWPTKARKVEKDDERKRVGEERRRLLAGIDHLYATGRRFAKRGSNVWTSPHLTDVGHVTKPYKNGSRLEPEAEETGLEKAKREMAEKTTRLEELRRKVMESEARNRQARQSAERSQSQQEDANAASTPQPDEALVADPSIAQSEDEASAEAQAASDEDLSEGPSDSSTSETSSEADSDQAPPEELSTKPANETTLSDDQSPVCKYFRASGWCRDGYACRFKHDPAHQREKPTHQQQSPLQRQGHEGRNQRMPIMEASTEGNKTIYQRLVEQEEEGDDKLALKVVKYLGEIGFFLAE